MSNVGPLGGVSDPERGAISAHFAELFLIFRSMTASGPMARRHFASQ